MKRIIAALIVIFFGLYILLQFMKAFHGRERWDSQDGTSAGSVLYGESSEDGFESEWKNVSVGELLDKFMKSGGKRIELSPGCKILLDDKIELNTVRIDGSIENVARILSTMIPDGAGKLNVEERDTCFYLNLAESE